MCILAGVREFGSGSGASEGWRKVLAIPAELCPWSSCTGKALQLESAWQGGWASQEILGEDSVSTLAPTLQGKGVRVLSKEAQDLTHNGTGSPWLLGYKASCQRQHMWSEK